VAPQGFSTFFSPSVFNLNVPLTNRIADGTDIPLQNPKHLVAQRSTCYSMHHPPHFKTETQYKYWLDVQLVHLCQSLWRISK
jgi:hypothetical protein